MDFVKSNFRNPPTALGQQQTHPKVMTNMLKKVFNWSEVQLSEVTSYKIHTLATL